MKKIYILLAFVASLLLTSCEYYPNSDFYASNNELAVNERVSFTNISDNADAYEWDFGDGTYSYNFDASHSYAAPGTYRVTLYAILDDKESSSSILVYVYEDASVVGFDVSTNITDVGYYINFTNTSDNVDALRWDFGDGYTSRSFNPNHAYDDYGIYKVTLEAWNNGSYVGKFEDYIEISPTTLEITVVEYYDYYTLSDASIILYPSYADWVNETNMIDEKITNNRGIATFSYLADQSYYIDIWEPNHNNYALADEDINFIRTLPLIPGQTNTFEAFVDYVPTSGKAAAREKVQQEKQLKIVKIERKYDEKIKAYKEHKGEEK